MKHLLKVLIFIAVAFLILLVLSLFGRKDIPPTKVIPDYELPSPTYPVEQYHDKG